ncbi:hypothetical protein K491DRAFT_66140 [Lophiostoma macrostomum CBS 122681]|uniref:ZZ-type domain-containing protein n=1 Tax=Lophiostoma macrostomum CBS 122681 TaxID=1314788 RepID=A0A6A6SWX2_9PLEO|nr:hypothetical protein K491DRAFT_66140 [Lophiostoma macrostomum CBS 122681]
MGSTDGEVIRNTAKDTRTSALPPLNSAIPPYMTEIIDACCSTEPNDRPPAWRILEMFPPEETYAEPKSITRYWKQPTKPEDCRELMRRQIYCNFCRDRTSKHYFYCSICSIGDFDICPRCFEKGRHCFDTNHYLREIKNYGEAQTFYTNVKDTGLRELLVAD